MDDKIIDGGTPTYSIFMAEDADGPVTVEFLGPFPKAPEDLPTFQMDVNFPVWQGSCFPTIVKSEAIVMVHPMVRNYYHIRQIEERTGRIAIAKMGYIELVKP